MDAIITGALSGLFVFLVLLYKHKRTSPDAAVIEQAAQHALMVEEQLQQALARAALVEALQAELHGYRQATQGMVSSDEYQRKAAEALELGSALSKTKEELDIVRGKQISERVRLGQVGEQILPFLVDFPYDSKRVRGLFQPIDLLVFNDDEVVFVEVKTGDATLTEKQRNIKRLIDEGKVRFEVHRISEKGYEIK